MTVTNCSNCGGIHYGVFECPYRSSPCVVCGSTTIWACSDCAIDGRPTHVCERPVCQDAHENSVHAEGRPPGSYQMVVAPLLR